MIPLSQLPGCLAMPTKSRRAARYDLYQHRVTRWRPETGDLTPHGLIVTGFHIIFVGSLIRRMKQALIFFYLQFSLKGDEIKMFSK